MSIKSDDAAAGSSTGEVELLADSFQRSALDKLLWRAPAAGAKEGEDEDAGEGAEREEGDEGGVGVAVVQEAVELRPATALVTRMQYAPSRSGKLLVRGPWCTVDKAAIGCAAASRAGI